MASKLYQTVIYRGVKVNVYDDDYGQCFYFKYKGKEYSCGTYNTDYYGEIISVIDDDLDESFYVDPVLSRRPSAKVYKSFGIWYMDYDQFDKMVVSYGDILPENERPTKEDLITQATAQMRMIDTYRENRRKYDEAHEN